MNCQWLASKWSQIFRLLKHSVSSRQEVIRRVMLFRGSLLVYW